MHELSNKKQTYVTTNKIETLNKIFSFMDNSSFKFSEIIENEGFQSVAKAIRKAQSPFNTLRRINGNSIFSMALLKSCKLNLIRKEI